MANDDVYGLAADEDILTHWEEILPQCKYFLVATFSFIAVDWIVKRIVQN